MIKIPGNVVFGKRVLFVPAFFTLLRKIARGYDASSEIHPHKSAMKRII